MTNTCNNNGHIYGSSGKCVFCATPKNLIPAEVLKQVKDLLSQIAYLDETGSPAQKTAQEALALLASVKEKPSQKEKLKEMLDHITPENTYKLDMGDASNRETEGGAIAEQTSPATDAENNGGDLRRRALNVAYMEMPEIDKYLDDDIEFRNDLGKWAERNYRALQASLKSAQPKVEEEVTSHEIVEIVTKDLRSSFPGIEYTMLYVLHTLKVNGLKIVRGDGG